MVAMEPTPREKSTKRAAMGLLVVLAAAVVLVENHQTNKTTHNECGSYSPATDSVFIFQSVVAACPDCIDERSRSRRALDSPLYEVRQVGRLRGDCGSGLLMVTEVDAADDTERQVVRFSLLGEKAPGEQGGVARREFSGRVALCIQALSNFPSALTCRDEL